MNGRRRFLYASVISIHDSSFLYPACRNCFSRLVQVSQRYSCHRCSFSCEAKDVHYRYKLSLGVADDSQLLKITVFGSCLDDHFGLSADALQRYIQDLTQDSNEHERERAQNLLSQATEFCFIGRNFIFGVKSSENKVDQLSFSSNSFLTSNGHEKDLVACQIAVPTVEDVGFTVLNFYTRLLQYSSFKSSQNDSPVAGSIGTVISQASRELSCLYQSCGKQGHPRSRHCVLRPWQLAFEFTSSSVNSSTSAEFAAGDMSNAIVHHSGETKTSTAGILLPGSQTPPISHLQCSGSNTKRNKEGKQEQEMDCELTFSVGQADLASASSTPMQIASTVSNSSALTTVRSYDNYASAPLQSTPYWENACFKTNGICGSEGDFEPTWSKLGSSSWISGQLDPSQYFKGYDEQKQGTGKSGESIGGIDSGNQGPNYVELHKMAVNYKEPQGPRWDEQQDTRSEEDDTCFRSNEEERSTSSDREHQYASSGEEHQDFSSNNNQESCGNVADARTNGFKKHLGDGSSDEHQGAGRSRLHNVASSYEHQQGSNSNEKHLASSTNVKQKGVSSDEVLQVSSSDKEHQPVHSYMGHRGVGTAKGLQSMRSIEEHSKVGNDVEQQATSNNKHHNGASSDEENRDASSDVEDHQGWSINEVQEKASSDDEHQEPSIEDEHRDPSSSENDQRASCNECQDNSSTAELGRSSSYEHNAVWDDLPFSESLSEFIAKVENSSNSTAQKHLKVSTSSSLNLSSASKNKSVDSHSEHSGGCLQLHQAKTYRQSKHLSSASCRQGQIVQNRIYSKNVLMRRKQGRHLDLSSSFQLPAPNCDSVNSSSSLSSSLSHFTRPQTVNGKSSKNDKSAEKRTGSLCLPTQSAPVHSTCMHLDKSPVSVVEGKTNLCHSSEDHTYMSEKRLGLETPLQDRSEKSDLKFVTDAQEVVHDSLPLDSSNGSDQNSYNGSSDLFSSSDKELEIVFETPRLPKHAGASSTSMLDKRHVMLQSDYAMTHRISSCIPSPQALHSVTEKSCSSSLCDSNQENIGSQDFIPSSQSTPHICSFWGKETSAKTQTLFSPINSKRGNSKLLHNELLQPASNRFKRRNAQDTPAVKTRTFSYAILDDSAPFSPSAELFESDSEDYIPPSVTKPLQAALFPKSTLLLSQIGKMVKSPSFTGKPCNYPDEEKSSVQKANECSDNSKQILIRESAVHLHSVDYTRTGKSNVYPFEFSSNSPQCSSENANYLSEGFTILEGEIDDCTGNWSPDLFAEKLIYSQQHKLVQKQLF